MKNDDHKCKIIYIHTYEDDLSQTRIAARGHFHSNPFLIIFMSKYGIMSSVLDS